MRKKHIRKTGKNPPSQKPPKPQQQQRPARERPARERPARERPQPPLIRLPRESVLIWGRHATAAVLANPARRIMAAYATPDGAGWLERLPQVANLPEPVIMERTALDAALAASPAGHHIYGDEKIIHQGIVLVARPLTPPHLEDWLATPMPPRPLVLLLDQITDSRNIGAMMRTCWAFGAAAMITTDRHCPRENALMLRAASGAAEHIPLIRVVNLARAMDTLKDHGFTLAAMVADGADSPHQLAGEERLGLIMGAEGKGLRRLTLERSDLRVSVEMNARAESLNVGVAAAIGLFAATNRP